MATIETNEGTISGTIIDEATIIREYTLADIGERAPVGMGWLRDLPDFRDYTTENINIVPHLDAIGISQPMDLAVPAKVDLRAYCSPVEDQGSIGSCTANAVVGMVEYFERRAFGKHIDASRLFLYKATRELLHWTGDTGAYLRSTIGALALFGVPPEEYWPYKVVNFDKEPTAFCYAFANDFRAISYFRLDDISTTPEALITKIKAGVAAGIPCVFGFTVYSSIAQAAKSGRIPYPVKGEKSVGGHAMLVVGYDDNMTIANSTTGATTKGALIIRNSWGPTWGDHGYGALPYEYVRNQQAVDFWSLTKADWTDTGQFKA
jgi:C1A family cysteine protease